MGKPLNLSDIQKTKYDIGAIVYNTNNYRFAVVLSNNCGSDHDPSSLVLEQSVNDGYILHTPPNRALIPTGRFVSLQEITNILNRKVETLIDRC